MQASRIKNIMYGVLLSDGSIDRNTNRFDMYSKHEDYIAYLFDVFSGLTHTEFCWKESYNKKYGKVMGYRMWSKRSAYLNKLYRIFYPSNSRKRLSRHIVRRLDEEALAHVWMCDGYLEHAKNRKAGKVQNIGWFCLEAYPKDELKLLQDRLKDFGVDSSLIKKPWGFGYRIRIGGQNLQKFISFVYPYILDCFKYKTILFYRRKESALDLPSAEHFIVEYNEVEDIVRHPLKKGKTDG